MIFKKIDQIPSFLAGDHTVLKEVLHPDKDGLKIPYSLAQAKIEVGRASLPHALKSGELYLFLNGQGKIIVDQKEQLVEAGDLVFVPPGANQYVENTGKVALEFYCIVSPEWRPEEEEVF